MAFCSSPGLALGPGRRCAAAGARGWFRRGLPAPSPPRPLRGSRAVTVGRWPARANSARPLSRALCRAARPALCSVPGSRASARALSRGGVWSRCACPGVVPVSRAGARALSRDLSHASAHAMSRGRSRALSRAGTSYPVARPPFGCCLAQVHVACHVPGPRALSRGRISWPVSRRFSCSVACYVSLRCACPVACRCSFLVARWVSRPVACPSAPRVPRALPPVPEAAARGRAAPAAHPELPRRPRL